jgi:hypothetical protein
MESLLEPGKIALETLCG